MNLDLKLPDPSEAPKSDDIKEVLLNVKSTVETKYNDKILVFITTSSTRNKEQVNIFSYAVYLSFVNRNKFSYRLFEVNCVNADGVFPVELNAFSGPSISFGTASTRNELEVAVEKIFADFRTRNIILSNYNL